MIERNIVILYLCTMPQTEVLFYSEPDGRSPVVIWLAELQGRSLIATVRVRAAIERLAANGPELRRPWADFLREGIYELRIRHGRVHVRILYSFHGRNRAVICHALTKEGKVPVEDLERAARRKLAFEANPRIHTYREV